MADSEESGRREGGVMKTVHVRIAVAVGASGAWSALGSTDTPDTDAAEIAADGITDTVYAQHFVEADVPVPESVTVVGVTVQASKGGTND